MNREINAIRISVLIIVGFGIITLFENGIFVPLLPGIDIAIVLLSFLFGIWNWKWEKALSIGAFIVGFGFLGAALSIWEILFSFETLSALDENLIFDYLLILKSISLLLFAFLCAIKSNHKLSKLLYLLGGIGMCVSLLTSFPEWSTLIFAALCALPRLLSLDKLKVPILWLAILIFQLINVITSYFMS